MKCENNNFELNDKVYFTVISGLELFTPKYIVTMKNDSIKDGIGYTIEFDWDNNTENIVEAAKQGRIQHKVNLCGESIFHTIKDALKEALDYFEKLCKAIQDKI